MAILSTNYTSQLALEDSFASIRWLYFNHDEANEPSDHTKEYYNKRFHVLDVVAAGQFILAVYNMIIVLVLIFTGGKVKETTSSVVNQSELQQQTMQGSQTQWQAYPVV
eukprot:TRINITY_DN34425_c0_g1_i1.p4 TRINITY_DN34425_c0_g1~~TRINITY_DN34425_c0_g1_i1.p4  ORF type:complete len:109 (+),score=3.72 TRINITY_DN34425_c0_g1_i1:522-848(+)